MRDLLVVTLRTVRAHALRFFLTSMGIVWGTAMLTVLLAYTDGFERHFQRQIDKIGPRVVYAFPGIRVKERVGERGAHPVELHNTDVEHIASLDSVERASPNLWVGLTNHRRDRTSKLLWTYGVGADAASIRSIDVAEGRFVSATDVATDAHVVFLGAKAKERLFGRDEAVGRTVHLDSFPFRVIGVAARKGDQILNMGPNDDELSLIPVTTAQRLFTHDDKPGVVIFAPSRRELSEPARRQVRHLMALHHDFSPDDERALGFFDIQDAVKVIDALGLGLQLFLGSAGLVTLLVGATGVMNIMLVVVGERTREVGLRKAVGATDRAIFVEFLAEAVAVTVLAGAAGGLLGCGLVALAASAVPADQVFRSPPELRATTAIAIACVLAAVGIAAGVLPARRASRVPPAVSLRAA